MFTCVYHPINGMQVVEEDEAYRMKASGLWFDSPKKAKDSRLKVEADIKKEKADDTVKNLRRSPNER